jgi:DNA-binding transcriptional LysR family regulator
MSGLTVAYDARLPHARWGALFHVFRLERRDVALAWRAVEFQAPGRSLLDGADIGLFLHPPAEAATRALTLDTSPMVVIMSAGNALAGHGELTVADVIDETFPGAPNVNPAWSAFWTLDEQRGAPATRTDDDVQNAEQGVEVVARGAAIATVPSWMVAGLSHPGVVALPLVDGPDVLTKLVWRAADDGDPAVAALVDLASAWAAQRPGAGANGRRSVPAPGAGPRGVAATTATAGPASTRRPGCARAAADRAP